MNMQRLSRKKYCLIREVAMNLRMPQVRVMLQQWRVLLTRTIRGRSIPESSEMVAEKGTPRSKSEECVLLMQVRKGDGGE